MTAGGGNANTRALRTLENLARARFSGGTKRRGTLEPGSASNEGVSWICLKSVAMGVAPRIGMSPVKSSKARMPRA